MNKYAIVAILAMASIATTVSASSVSGAAGITRLYNFTTKQVEMYPQCFPWTSLTNYQRMSILDIYINQDICRAQRAIDFRF